ncbi:MAG: hypothetical protein CMN60_20210 [Sphingobium sp.]|nr:hypothetical protein [Sphingobium sp.]
MLIQPTYSLNETPGKIFMFQMSNGAEVIGKVKSVDDTSLIIEKPIRLAIQGQGQIMPFSYAIGNPEADTVIFMRHALTSYYLPSKDMEEMYISNTTGIDLG